MIQRLGLAVACLPNAPVLVLDEPTSSLDPEGAIQFREFLASLKRAGKTIIFSSHALADVEQLADRVAILVGGRLVALDSVATLREELMRTSQMRVVLNKSDEWVIQTARTAGAANVYADGNALVVRCQPQERFEILRAINEAGGCVAHFATEGLSIEHIYMRYVNQTKQSVERSEGAQCL